ncbi:hypothetical protein L596_028690 [Steinernema carpocapsae]|uniref:Uncharacterized protein n=1 Tax=Steinernema carpocapsae TaxID=34508 RepID=A0A4U5LZ41_STECR|nr:hypothetical protein L596_028690 [Steinernema carpocapsae]
MHPSTPVSSFRLQSPKNSLSQNCRCSCPGNDESSPNPTRQLTAVPRPLYQFVSKHALSDLRSCVAARPERGGGALSINTGKNKPEARNKRDEIPGTAERRKGKHVVGERTLRPGDKESSGDSFGRSEEEEKKKTNRSKGFEVLGTRERIEEMLTMDKIRLYGWAIVVLFLEDRRTDSERLGVRYSAPNFFKSHFMGDFSKEIKNEILYEIKQNDLDVWVCSSVTNFPDASSTFAHLE